LSIGLLGLLDDIAGLAKVAAASIDDVAGMAAKAGLKATGAVIDDAAVTPRYIQGFSANRELPIVAKIAKGSIRNKLFFLLPAALALGFFLPWAITPLLMIGGAYLCYEGAEKVYQLLFPHQAHDHETSLTSVAVSPKSLEDEKVASAIKTDFILSAEIMAIALAELSGESLLSQAMVLVLVAFGITLAVYGGVALIVKADDFGLSLARNTGEGMGGRLVRTFGSGLVKSMPIFMSMLSVVGTAAMIWVGGGIIVHGLDEFGLPQIGGVIHHAAEAAAHAIPAISGVLNWTVESAGYGLVGLAIGAALIPIAGYLISPAWRALKRLRMQPTLPKHR
jgi:predicted DNA repair protein MutK